MEIEGYDTYLIYGINTTNSIGNTIIASKNGSVKAEIMVLDYQPFLTEPYCYEIVGTYFIYTLLPDGSIRLGLEKENAGGWTIITSPLGDRALQMTFYKLGGYQVFFGLDQYSNIIVNNFTPNFVPPRDPSAFPLFWFLVGQNLPLMVSAGGSFLVSVENVKASYPCLVAGGR